VDVLAWPDGNLCACGDDDQLIHGWRHADPRHILCFHERHPGHAQIVRGRNFRSRAEIFEAGVRCVSHNERRAGKALIAMRGAGAGGTVRVRAFANEYAEANWVAAQIADALPPGRHRPRSSRSHGRDRAAAARARARRDPAPCARIARAVRAHRGP